MNIFKTLLILFFFAAINTNAQLISKEKKDTLVDIFLRINNKIYKFMQVAPAPIITYSSETNWVFGLAKFKGYKLRKKDSISRPSSMNATFAVSLEKQISANLSNTNYFGENKNIVSISIKYEKYPRLWYLYNATTESDDYFENVTTNYVSASIQYVRELIPRYYFGISYYYDNYYKIDYEKNGLLENINFYGKNGGTNSGLGINTQFDSRDNRFSTYKGLYINFEGIFFSNLIGSDYNFNRYIFDFRYFKKIRKFIIGYQFYNQTNIGDIPFYNMSQLGGTERMRGFYFGQIRDKVLIDNQAELRKHIFWIIDGATYIGVGTVASDFETVSKTFDKDSYRLLYSYGAGIRLTVDPVNRIKIRLDLGFGYDQFLNRNYQALFFGFSEAF